MLKPLDYFLILYIILIPVQAIVAYKNALIPSLVTIKTGFQLAWFFSIGLLLYRLWG